MSAPGRRLNGTLTAVFLTDLKLHQILYGIDKSKLLSTIPTREEQTMPLSDEPKGWRILQAMAQSESDPERLASIINEMNRLLDAHERQSHEPASRIDLVS